MVKNCTDSFKRNKRIFLSITTFVNLHLIFWEMLTFKLFVVVLLLKLRSILLLSQREWKKNRGKKGISLDRYYKKTYNNERCNHRHFYPGSRDWIFLSLSLSLSLFSPSMYTWCLRTWDRININICIYKYRMGVLCYWLV